MSSKLRAGVIGCGSISGNHIGGFILTGRDVPHEFWIDGLPPENLATSAPGVFAVGDVRAGSMKRVASATGEGASVVPIVHDWLVG